MGLFGMTKAKNEIEHTNISTIMSKLKNLFRDAIGKDKGKTLSEIYREIYGKVDDTPFVRMYRINMILASISAMKKHSNYFIISSKRGVNRVWFVVKDYDEAGEYCSDCDRKIVGLKIMKERCVTAVEEKHYLRLDIPRKRITKQIE